MRKAQKNYQANMQKGLEEREREKKNASVHASKQINYSTKIS